MKQYKYHLRALCLLTITLYGSTLYATTLTEQLDALIEHELPHTTVGVLVKNINTNQIIYTKNADKRLSPASSMKLFPAAASLYHFAPNHHFETSLSYADKNVYLTFSGAPALTTDNLIELLAQLKEHHSLIEGDLVLDTSRFKPPYYPDGTSYDDLGWYFAAPDTAAILNENAATYLFISAKQDHAPIQIKPKNTEHALTLINQVITVNQEEEKNHCGLHLELMADNTMRLFGCLAKHDQPKTMRLAIPDPILYAKHTVQQLLEQNSITLKGRIISGHTPSDAELIATCPSDDLMQLITHMLQTSDNLYASSLTKQLGYAITHEGTYKQGAYAIKHILAKHTALDMAQIELADGVGTRYNLAPPEQLVILLETLYHDKNIRPHLLNLLPQAGVSGSLQDRLKKTELDAQVFAKTGSMHDISSLSGYVVTESHDPLVFSIIINGINTPLNTAKALEDHILVAIHEALVNLQSKAST
jgi:serine-type D-Ala-D-Ala carboxypeptidase/endopeptidase (penicillin-binding protein 4)